jgi:cysteine desulfurase
VFTGGGTEANNLALHAAPGLITSRIEHPSVVQVALQVASRGAPVRWLSVPGDGRIDPQDVERALVGMPPGSWVALMAANHETGVLQPIDEVAEIVTRTGAFLHVDAVQALGKLPSEVFHAATTVAITAHKIRGPKGIGALAFRNAKAPSPFMRGGAQERGIRPGTQDAALASGFLVALKHAASGPERHSALAVLRDQLEAALGQWAQVNGAGAARLAHVSNLSFKGWRGAELAAALDLEGVLVSSGSACSAGTSEPSAVIAAMLGQERAESAVRFSLGETTTAEQVARAIAVVERVVTRRS